MSVSCRWTLDPPPFFPYPVGTWSRGTYIRDTLLIEDPPQRSISIPVIWALASKTSVLGNDPMLWFCLMLMPTGPPAIKLTALADVNGSSEHEKMSIAKFLTVSYFRTMAASILRCSPCREALCPSHAVSRSKEPWGTRLTIKIPNVKYRRRTASLQSSVSPSSAPCGLPKRPWEAKFGPKRQLVTDRDATTRDQLSHGG